MAGSIYFTGLASGLDTDSVIKGLMELERAPLKQIQRRKSEQELRQGAWRDLYARLSNLKGRLADLKLAASFTGVKVTSSDPRVLTASAHQGTPFGIYRIEVLQLARAHQVASLNPVADTSTLEGSFSLSVAGITATISVQKGSSLQDIARAVNEQAGDRIRAAVIDQRLVLTSKISGQPGVIELGDPQGILRALGLIRPDGTPNTVQEPQNAKLKIEGLELERSSNNINDAIPGVSLNLAAPGVAEVRVDRDSQRALEVVKSLLDQYNSVMDFIQDKAQKGGPLQGDPLLARIKTGLWQLITGRIGEGGRYSAAGELGISTGACSGGGPLTFDRSGRLALEAAKLEEALDKDGQEVYTFFRKLAEKMEKYLDLLIERGEGLIPARQRALESLIRDLEGQKSWLEAMLGRREEQLRRQFTAMEKALAGLQSQGQWLANQINILSRQLQRS